MSSISRRASLDHIDSRTHSTTVKLERQHIPIAAVLVAEVLVVPHEDRLDHGSICPIEWRQYLSNFERKLRRQPTFHRRNGRIHLSEGVPLTQDVERVLSGGVEMGEERDKLLRVAVTLLDADLMNRRSVRPWDSATSRCLQCAFRSV